MSKESRKSNLGSFIKNKKEKLFSEHYKYKSKQYLSSFFVSLFRSVLIIGISYLILMPVFTKISASLMSVEDLTNQTVHWIPRNPNLENYANVIYEMEYFQALFNTFLLTFGISVLQVFSSTLTGYGLARFNFKGSNLVFGLVLFTLVVPPYMIMVPQYMNFRFFDILGIIPEGGFNLINSYWPFILPALTGNGLRNGLFIFVMRQFFKGMPDNLEEAAYVDGAGPFRTFLRVMLPGATSSIVIVFLFSFVWMWTNEYQISLFLSNDSAFLPTLLADLENVVWYDDPQRFSLMSNAAMLLFIAPLLLLYMFMQRYFIESIERTGIVG